MKRFNNILIRTLTVFLFLTINQAAAIEGIDQQDNDVPAWIEDDLLTNYIQRALNQNPGIRSAEQQYRAAFLEAPQARWSLADPQLGAMFFPQGMLWPGGEQYASISLQQMFPWFGTLRSREAMANIMGEADYETYRDEVSQTIYKVRAVYYEMFEVQQKVNVHEEHLQLFESFINIARARLETGRGRSAEVISIEIEQEDLRNEIERLKDKVVSLQQDMASLLNEADPDAITLPDTLPEPGLPDEPAELRQQIADQHPAVSKWDKLNDFYQQKEHTAKLEGRPDIGIGAEYMVMSPTDQFDFGHNGDNMFVPMVSINIPIYRSRYSAKREQALLKAEQASDLKQKQILDLHRQWEDELAKYKDARRLTEHYREQIMRSNRALNLLQQDYAGEKVVFEEVLRMQQRLLDYEIYLAEAIAENNRSIAKLEYIRHRNE